MRLNPQNRTEHKVRPRGAGRLRRGTERSDVRHDDSPLPAAARAASQHGLHGRSVPRLQDHPHRRANRAEGQGPAVDARLAARAGVRVRRRGCRRNLEAEKHTRATLEGGRRVAAFHRSGDAPGARLGRDGDERRASRHDIAGRNVANTDAAHDRHRAGNIPAGGRGV